MVPRWSVGIDDGPTFEVIAIDDGVATLVQARDADGAYAQRSEHGPVGQERAALDSLVVISDFGEPVLPGFRHLGSIERGGDKPHHIVINGENHHALEALRFTHAGRLAADPRADRDTVRIRCAALLRVTALDLPPSSGVASILGDIVGLTWLAGRIYSNAALHLGARALFMEAFVGHARGRFSKFEPRRAATIGGIRCRLV